MEKKKLRPWMAVLFVLAFGLDIFVLSGFLGAWFGVWGTLLHEIVLALLAVLLAALLRADLRSVFPFRRPRAVKTAGTLVLWLGTFLAAMAVTMLVSYFFPQEVMGASQDLQDIMVNIPVLFSLFLVALTPAVCEEMAFRGGFLSCLRGLKSKWAGILIVAAVFGMFHGSVWRFIPTAILGISLGYLLVETDNLFYSMLFHFVNNAVPVLLLGLLSLFPVEELYGSGGMEAVQTSISSHLPLASVAVYIIFSCGAPFLIYIGRYLIHRGEPGYEGGLFPADRKKTLLVLLGVSAYIFLIGLILYLGSVGPMMRYMAP